MQEMTMEEVELASGGRALYDIFVGVVGGAAWDGIKGVVDNYRATDWGGPGGDAYFDPSIML